MTKSTATRGSFAFAQQVEGHMCHISFSVEGNKGSNVQIPMYQVAPLIENLARVLEADRVQLVTKVVDLEDELEKSKAGAS